MRAKRSLMTLGERAGHERLGQPGQILDQDVAVGEEREQHELQDGPLADHDALDLVEDAGRQRRCGAETR
jgi:hypothetical protein